MDGLFDHALANAPHMRIHAHARAHTLTHIGSGVRGCVRAYIYKTIFVLGKLVLHFR